MTTIEEHQARRELLGALRSSGDPAAVAQALKLEKLYHDREMAGLADDVYDSAAMVGQAPVGWMRLSEHPDKLREFAHRIQVSPEKLMEHLRPDESGFRAEIYLPDPDILGPGYAPSVVIKGSSGKIFNAQGESRESAAEDFLANNFPQSIGLRADYYDRAMSLGLLMKRGGVEVEFAGHSLAGGMASASAAVSGFPATTFNAAGLHPETAPRFARENNIPLSNVNELVRAYQVSGELLNDGIQENVHRLDERHRAQLAGVMNEVAEVLREVPEVRAIYSAAIRKRLPEEDSPTAAASADAFLEKLATQDTKRLLRELPLAAGDVQPILVPKMRADKEREIFDRPDLPSLQELSDLAGPTLTVAHAAARGSKLGREASQVVVATGQVVERTLDRSGDVARGAANLAADIARPVPKLAGAAVSASIDASGAGVAKAREVAGEVSARIDEAQGEVQARGAKLGASILRRIGDRLPDSIDRYLDDRADKLERAGDGARRQNAAEAAQARGGARQDVAEIKEAVRTVTLETMRVTAKASDLQQGLTSGAGEVSNKALDEAGQGVRGLASHAPAFGAAAGAHAGASIGLAGEINVSGVAKTARLAGGALPSGGEAFERHLMTETVVPSMDALIDQEEAKAARQLSTRQSSPAVLGGSSSANGRYLQGHPDADLIQALEQRLPRGTSIDKVAEAALAVKQAGIKEPGQIDQVFFQGDYAFVMGKTPGFRAMVDVSAPPPPVQETLRRLDELNQRQAQELGRAQTQNMQMESRNQAGPGLSP